MSSIAGHEKNSADPDQTPRFVGSDLSLHCLPRPVCPTIKGNMAYLSFQRNMHLFGSMRSDISMFSIQGLSRYVSIIAIENSVRLVRTFNGI